MLIVALVAGLLTQFFPCCAFAIRSFSKVSATPGCYAIFSMLCVCYTQFLKSECATPTSFSKGEEGRQENMDLKFKNTGNINFWNNQTKTMMVMIITVMKMTM